MRVCTREIQYLLIAGVYIITLGKIDTIRGSSNFETQKIFERPRSLSLNFVYNRAVKEAIIVELGPVMIMSSTYQKSHKGGALAFNE